MKVGGSRTSTTATSGRCVDQRAQQRGAVVDGRDDLEAVGGQEPDQPVPQEGQVLAEDNSHGSSMVTTVGPPTGLVTAIVPSKAASRRSIPRSPLPARRVGTAGAVVADDRDQPVGRCAPAATQARLAPLCLTTLASASATAK